MAYFMLYLPLQIIITHLITPFEKQAAKRSEKKERRRQKEGGRRTGEKFYHISV